MKDAKREPFRVFFFFWLRRHHISYSVPTYCVLLLTRSTLWLFLFVHLPTLQLGPFSLYVYMATYICRYCGSSYSLMSGSLLKYMSISMAKYRRLVSRRVRSVEPDS
ncbi:hypothetical protein GGS24DRAFT_462184 [Hypoxylon argillaceum]|nr:hypothetical protein GGS24DRAFT_462184 [Hypoxylon argillaceum]